MDENFFDEPELLCAICLWLLNPNSSPLSFLYREFFWIFFLRLANPYLPAAKEEQLNYSLDISSRHKIISIKCLFGDV